ncbi:MAG: DUF1688 family protein, partial [Hyphomicrobiaceae bacterium]
MGVALTVIDPVEAADWLLSPEAVRENCALIYQAGILGALSNFEVRPENLPIAAREVVDTIYSNYPTLVIPPHARWRHFVIDGRDRWLDFDRRVDLTTNERLRIRVELAVVSVLLDAGAGPKWHYSSPTTSRLLRRSEGLAIASLELFLAGGFSVDPDAPWRADAAGLTNFTVEDLISAFQIGETNPLEGLEGRVGLLNNLGRVVAQRSDAFGVGQARLGCLADHFLAKAKSGRLPARTILMTLLDVLGPIWPGRETLAGRNLGDTWRHPLAAEVGSKLNYVPFHKLSQWLTYSLFEPLEQAGLEITQKEVLTGLAEYRNGGLFVDTGVLVIKDPSVREMSHEPASELIVEWRALTICLLDEIAIHVRRLLGLTSQQLPLVSVLEGGT